MENHFNSCSIPVHGFNLLGKILPFCIILIYCGLIITCIASQYTIAEAASPMFVKPVLCFHDRNNFKEENRKALRVVNKVFISHGTGSLLVKLCRSQKFHGYCEVGCWQFDEWLQVERMKWYGASPYNTHTVDTLIV